MARAVAVPVDASAPLARLHELALRVDPRLVIGDSPITGSRGEPIPLLTPAELGGLRTEKANTIGFVREHTLADVLFTTGTTGRPKGVMVTHGNIAAAARHINQVIGNRAEDVEVVPLPLNHSFGLMRLRCNVLSGGTLVLCNGFRMPGQIFSALADHAATGLVGVPAGFALLLRFGAEGLGASSQRLRYVEIGSASMPLAHKQALCELLPHTALWMHYGLTEASRSAFIELHRDRNRLDTIGKPSPGIKVSVRDEHGVEVRPGHPGLLWLSGASVALGYFQDPELSARVFVDGWVCTGDVASVAADGYISLHGRRDDMINVGGYNVAPDEVERVLAEHPAIEDAGCIAMPDPKGISGSVVRACLVARKGTVQPSARELSTWLAERLEHYRIPARYDWVASIPRSGSGKILRAALRVEQNATSPKPETV
jgi:long-chain acyl-CoA synthetase